MFSSGQQTVDAIENCLDGLQVHFHLAITCTFNKRIDHRPGFGPPAVAVPLGQSLAEERSEADTARRPAVRVAGLAGEVSACFSVASRHTDLFRTCYQVQLLGEKGLDVGYQDRQVRSHIFQ